MPVPRHAPLLKAKITLPPAQPLRVSRQRLLDLMSEALKRPFTLLSAPAGFGKTTLLSTWVNEADDRPDVAWLGLDEDDSEPVRFFDYLRTALQTVEPDVGGTAISPLSGMRTPTPKDLMTSLLGDLAKAAHPIALVLDDYHTIDNPDIDAALAFLVEHMPDHVRLILSTREDPRLPLARWRTRRLATEIRIEHLRFTPDEAASFIARRTCWQKYPTARCNDLS
jgi:ATP/maltotriose-dependent transcriptional regulator MalT